MFRQAIIAGISRELVFLEMKPNAVCDGCTMQCNQRWIRFFDQQSDSIVVSRRPHSRDERVIYDNGFFTNQHKPGQSVKLKLDSSELIKASLLSYMQPLLIIVLFICLGALAFSLLGLNADLGGLLAAVLSFFVFIKYKSNKMISSPKVTFF